MYIAVCIYIVFVFRAPEYVSLADHVFSASPSPFLDAALYYPVGIGKARIAPTSLSLLLALFCTVKSRVVFARAAPGLAFVFGVSLAHSHSPLLLLRLRKANFACQAYYCKTP
jgi:hypothetical protein